MPQFKPFDYGRVIGQAENIRNARTRNALMQRELNSGNQYQNDQMFLAKQRNALIQDRNAREQTEFDRGEKDADALDQDKKLYRAFSIVAADPSRAQEMADYLRTEKLANFDVTGKTPQELQAGAEKMKRIYGNQLSAGGKGPSAVQEYNFFQGLSPEKKAEFLRIKRAQPGAKFVDTGDTIKVIDSQTAQPITTIDKKLTPAQQPKNVSTTENIKGEQKRFNDLRTSKAGRRSSIKKAKKFLKAFTEEGASSGAGRKALSYLPGVYSKQGEFDEEFNAFAEVAARQALKASGEIRPTDADVKGMKLAMFGVGRDEDVNITLLTDYIAEQQVDEDEYLNLLKGKKPATQITTPQTAAEFNALPSGAVYIDPDDGKQYRKP